jgi:hypothetical protein
VCFAAGPTNLRTANQKNRNRRPPTAITSAVFIATVAALTDTKVSILPIRRSKSAPL